MDAKRRFPQEAAASSLRKVAAALSAAVTTTKQQETALTSQAEPSQQKSTSQTPAALRERGSGGEALLSEKRPLPQKLPNRSLFRREREGGDFSSEKSPPSQHPSLRILHRLRRALGQDADVGGCLSTSAGEIVL